MLGAGTAMVYPTLLAAVDDVAHPSWRARAVGVYWLWSDAGFAVGALVAGVLADLISITVAIWAIATLTPCPDASSPSGSTRPVVVDIVTCVTAQLRKDGPEPDAVEFEVAAGVLKLLADPTRLRIVWALLHGEHSVNDLADHVGARPPAVSQHLAKLRAARLVRARRDGTRIFYAARNEHIEHLAEEALLQADHLVTGGRHHRPRAETA